MDTNRDSFHPGDLTTSGFRFYSIGIVAANKALDNHNVEVCPIEQFTMLDGWINDNVDTKSASGSDSLGGKYSVKADMSNTVTATWARLNGSNRLSSPDVRRGELVMLYQFANSSTYYWDTYGFDKSRRRLETIVLAISGTRDESATHSPENMYWIEFSTHKKTITFHTSKADGEPYTYDGQIDCKTGRIILKDDIGNSLLLNSGEHRWRVENTDKSLIDMHTTIIDIYARDEVNITTKKLTTKTEETFYNAQSLYSVKTSDYILKNNSYKEDSGTKDVKVGGGYNMWAATYSGNVSGNVTWTGSYIKLSAPTIELDGAVLF